MKTRSTKFSKDPFKIISFILLIGLLFGCLGGASSRRTKLADKTTDGDTSVGTPTNLGNSPFLEWGKTKTTADLKIYKNFKDIIYLRGTKIHKFLALEANRTEDYCLVVPFPNGSSGELMILPATSNFQYNESSKGPEYFFQILMVDEEINKAYCGNSQLTAGLSKDFSTYTKAYHLSKICLGSCPLETISDPLQLYTAQGTKITDPSIHNLNIIYVGMEETKATGATCHDTATCKALGDYDCCLDQQCVKDRGIKSNVDTSSSTFILAYQDVLNNPNHYGDYPDYFYQCGSYVDPGDNTDDDLKNLSPEFIMKKELYECSTPLVGEMSLCTVTFDDMANQISVGTSFETKYDDRNFSLTYMGSNSSKIGSHSIHEIILGGVSIYRKSDSITPDATKLEFDSNTNNDDLSSGQKVKVLSGMPDRPLDDKLRIKYQIDGSCEEINSNLSKCYKVYVQGADDGTTIDHVSTNSQYKLPFYADLTLPITVTVDNYNTQEEIHWKKTSNPSSQYIEFIPFNSDSQTGINIYNSQIVKITFYTQNSAVYNSKKEAVDAIYEMCHCSSNSPCTLAPVYQKLQGINQIIDYECQYANASDDNTPLETVANVSAKSIPLRYFDTNGLSHDNPTQSTIEQEGSVFEYADNNLLKPNNNVLVSGNQSLLYVGFNEIYGSLDPKDKNGAKPPYVVEVKKGFQYDLAVNNGTFTPCTTCGSDYYSSMNKIFPANFSYQGGGYRPSPNRSEKKNTESYDGGNYRGDDLLYGRACFLPATMIPWTYSPNSDIEQQRKIRLKGQHFLFANGYQRDWFGFDYGSLIGSFDGVRWFSIGNGRRVMATTTRLYLAINAYFSDLTIDSYFSVKVSEVFAGGPQSSDSVIYDFESEGAECQKYHLCETDSDCITQLGHEYTCQQIGDMKTSWPYFDSNGMEIPGVEHELNIANLIIGGIGSNNTTKRCVYRGRGAPCIPDYYITNKEDSFAQTTKPGLNACAPNYYCQEISPSGVNAPLFNNRINRFGKSPANQNEESFITEKSDLFGLAARILGRPFKYHGDEEIDSEAKTSLTTNMVKAICLPGKDLSDPSATYREQHGRTPTSSFKGDKALGLGMSGTETTSFSPDSLSSCPILDDNGNYLYYQKDYYDLPLENETIKQYAATQILSTNLLKVFYDSINTPNLITDVSTPLDTQTLQENRCLKAPGSPCFASEECAPSSFISKKLRSLDGIETQLYNEFEFEYWTETLVCGQARPKESSSFNLTENKCCRETGENLTIHQPNQIDVNDFSATPIEINTVSAPSVDLPPSDPTRYSRFLPAYLSMKDSTPVAGERQIPPLLGPSRNACLGNINNCHITPDINSSTITRRPQFMTIQKISERTCCTGHWVRNFHEDNGKGHKFSAEKMQVINKEIFKCKAFVPRSTAANFQCTDAMFDCHAKNILPDEAKATNEFMSSLELLGIPNVLIKSTEHANISCNVYIDPSNIGLDTDDTRAPNGQPLPGTVRYVDLNNENKDLPTPIGIPEYTNGTDSYFAANDPRNFDMSLGLRMIFSDHSFSCCLPAGEAYDFNFTDNDCCTGTAFTDQGSNQKRCCLPSYTNLTTYLSRYVSSEAAHLDDSLFDPLTGRLPPSIVMQVAQNKQLCCSGQTKTGLAYDTYPVPGSNQTNQNRNRFLYLSTDVNAELYDRGLRWNTDVYCVPEGID